MRFYGRKEERRLEIKKVTRRKGSIFILAFHDLLDARERDGRSLGELLGDSIKDSVNTLLVIGGFIILFSVITEILTAIGLVEILTKFILLLLAPFGIAKSMVLPIIGGIFEITNGASLSAQAAAPLFQRVAICSAIIAWSGLSVHAQVATMVNGTDIRVKPYIFARMLHAVLAAGATFIFLSPSISTLMPVHLPLIFNNSIYTIGFFDRFLYLFNNLLLVFGVMLIISLAIAVIQRFKIIVFRYKE